jgi:glycolate oxidase
VNHSVDLDTLVKDLIEIVGAGQVLFSGERFDAASKDATAIVRPPTAVVEITSLDQIPRLILMAKNHGIGLIARGAGTGLSGGALADDGGVVLLLDKFDKIISVDKEKRIAIVEPAVITQDLADRAASAGLFYPPDPASVAESTIAGNVAECAGGLQCRKYGVTKDYVLGIEGYDGDANFIQTGIFAEDEVYDLTSLVVGSEGTLLIITRIALQLIDPPEARRT